MKKYIYRVNNEKIEISIAFYADTPNKNYRLYYCGSDTGARYEYLGNAEKALLNIVRDQMLNGVRGHVFHLATKNEIPRRGSNA